MFHERFEVLNSILIGVREYFEDSIITELNKDLNQVIHLEGLKQYPDNENKLFFTIHNHKTYRGLNTFQLSETTKHCIAPTQVASVGTLFLEIEEILKEIQETESTITRILIYLSSILTKSIGPIQGYLPNIFFTTFHSIDFKCFNLPEGNDILLPDLGIIEDITSLMFKVQLITEES